MLSCTVIGSERRKTASSTSSSSAAAAAATATSTGLLSMKPLPRLFVWLVVVLQLLAVVDRCSGSEGASWSYGGHGATNGPANWSHFYHDCDGHKQSPINILTSTVTVQTFVAITFSNYDVSNGFLPQLTNNGHTAQLTLVDGPAATITGASFPGTYRLVQFHMHWGKDSTAGSEHTVNDKKYPLEIHFVHYKADYGNLSQALTHDDGVAVLGVFAEIGNRNEAFQKLVDNFSAIKYAGRTVNLTNTFAMRDLLPSNVSNFYRYQGSLTTPGCNEVVTWTVFNERITVSEVQMASLRTLSHNGADAAEDPLVDNYRPVQEMYGRSIYSSFQPPPPLSSSGGFNNVIVSICGRLQLAMAVVAVLLLSSTATRPF